MVMAVESAGVPGWVTSTKCTMKRAWLRGEWEAALCKDRDQGYGLGRDAKILPGHWADSRVAFTPPHQ